MFEAGKPYAVHGLTPLPRCGSDPGQAGMIQQTFYSCFNRVEESPWLADLGTGKGLEDGAWHG